MVDHSDKTIIDCHLHCVDFFQRGKKSDDLIRALDSVDLSKAIVMGLPVIKKWNVSEPIKPERAQDDNGPCYYCSYTDQIVADLFEELSSTHQKRIAPLLCGFNPTDKLAIKQVEFMLKKYEFWAGVGEILLRHDHLTNLIQDERAYATHPAMEPIYKLCSQRKLPIVIHQNSNSEAKKKTNAYVKEIETVLTAFPKLKFVWAHGGMSPRSSRPFYYYMLNSMMKHYPNLYLDVSWTLVEEMEQSSDNEEGEKWNLLLEQFADRIMLGSDVLGNYRRLPVKIKPLQRLLDTLPQSIRYEIAFGTAQRLFFA